jgi:hypothetical protein
VEKPVIRGEPKNFGVRPTRFAGQLAHCFFISSCYSFAVAMTTNNAGESIWAEGLAARLRLLQVDCADQPLAKRQEFLAEEIERALKSVPEEKRAVFLDVLAERFPAWGAASAAYAPAASQPPTTAPTPDELVAQLARIVPELSHAARANYSRTLMEAGLLPKGQEGNGWVIPEELRKKLGLQPEQSVAPENVVQLFALLVFELLRLDTVAWETWGKLAPRSSLRKEFQAAGDLKAIIDRFLRGDPEIKSQQAQQTLEKSRRLMAGLLAAIPLAGKDFAEEYMVRLLPKNIEDVASSRGGGLFGDSMEKKCWIKYKELAYADPESIEKRLRDAVAKRAEEMAKKA